jgi:hypothetical protein
MPPFIAKVSNLLPTPPALATKQSLNNNNNKNNLDKSFGLLLAYLSFQIQQLPDLSTKYHNL